MKKKKIMNSVLVILLITSVLGVMFTGTTTAQEYSGDIWATDNEGETRENFPETAELYFTVVLDQSESVEITVDFLEDEDDPPIERRVVTTDDEGIYEAHEDVFFDPIDLSELEGEYLLVLRYDGEELEQKTINIYEPEYIHSSVVTTEDDHETEKDYFFDGERIYFRADMEDQYGWDPVEMPDLSVVIERDGEEVDTTGLTYYYEEGSLFGDFWLSEYEFGEYTLRIMDNEDEVEYASTYFTVVNVAASIEPEVHPYTQGQDIELRVESNYPNNINVSIRDSDDQEDYSTMDGAEWNDQELVNEFWSTEYTIPMDEEDGTYYLWVESAADGENLETIPFQVEKYTLDIETDKAQYLPGEEVTTFYSVTNYLDGSEYEDVDVEWQMEYRTVEGEDEILSGEADDGEFVFTLPEDVLVGSGFEITVSAIDTQERYEDEESITRFVSDLELDLTVDSDEYFVGQKAYVNIETPVGGVEVDLELEHEGELIEEKTVVTDGGGHYTAVFDLEYSGPYLVRGNATWNDMYELDDDDFEVFEESRRLSVMLETDRGTNPYYRGEEGTVFYTVTRRGETITDEVSVQYRLSSDQRVLARGFADGGEIDFEIPEDYSPDREEDLEMEVVATLDREVQGVDDITIPVSIGDILLNPSTRYYEANDVVSFNYEFEGISDDEIESMEYRVLDENPDAWQADPEIIMSGTPTEGSFEITIPEHPEDSYYVELQAVTEDGHSIETIEQIHHTSGFYLRTEIITEPRYTTDVYEPGQEIEISYELVSRDGSPLPDTVRVVCEIAGHPEVYSFRTDETEGTFTITVPELSNGEHYVSISVEGESTMETVEVDNNPSFLNRRVYGTLSITGLVAAILILLALIMVGKLYQEKERKRSLFGEPKETKESSEEPTNEGKSLGKVEGSDEGFVIEKGEAEPEDQWSSESQIEPGEKE